MVPTRTPTPPPDLASWRGTPRSILGQSKALGHSSAEHEGRPRWNIGVTLLARIAGATYRLIKKVDKPRTGPITVSVNGCGMLLYRQEERKGTKLRRNVAGTGRSVAVSDTYNTIGSGNGDLQTPLPELDVTETMGPLKKISVGTQSIANYASILGGEKLEELKSLAAELRDARVLHINSTAYGGGVAELLRSHIPLLRSLGLDAEWMVIGGDEPFFSITKAFHNALQGGEYRLEDQTKEIYLANNSRNVRYLNGDYDYIVVHDPQPLPMRLLHGANGAKWVWRCHIDTASPEPSVWEFLKPYVDPYDAMVFTMDQYAPPDLPREKVSIMPPAIDPLSPKNMALPGEFCRKIVGWVGVDVDRPLICQVSRFDPWKDPLGVIEVYRRIKDQMPGLQLALLGHVAMDDPQGWLMYQQVVDASRGDPDIYIFTNYTAASSIEVNAFQHHADVVLQNSIREGFGLVVSEALWKGTPVVAGRAGGIPMQLQDGQGGFLIDGIDQCAEKVLYLLQHPTEARRMGHKGRQHVRSNFLTPRLLHDELRLLSSLN